MAIFRLESDVSRFPHPSYAESDGLLAVGGNLAPDTLLQAYKCGIFPWYSNDSPILWWSPDPRLVLDSREVNIGRSMRPILRRSNWQFRMDTAFAEVIGSCAEVERKGQDGTWIHSEVVEAYSRLHQLGYAHSAETWIEGELRGGLYGLCIGRAFFGESMFALTSNASKYALIKLCEYLKGKSVFLIDCQTPTSHLESMGAKLWSRSRFLTVLSEAVRVQGPFGKWT